MKGMTTQDGSLLTTKTSSNQKRLPTNTLVLSNRQAGIIREKEMIYFMFLTKNYNLNHMNVLKHKSYLQQRHCNRCIESRVSGKFIWLK